MTAPDKILIGVLLGALMAVTIPKAAEAQATPLCGERAAVMKQLESKYSERPQSMGLSSTGAVVEVLASASGSWTILLTTPSGLTCLLASGEYWEPVEKKAAGFTPSALRR